MAINYWQVFEPNIYYHIYNRSNNKEAIFLKDENYRYFLRQWNKYLSPYFQTIAYALLPNHFHFITRVEPYTTAIKEAIQQEQTTKSRKYLSGELALDAFLQDQMKRFFISYAKAFNKANDRMGSLFQKRFKRVAISDEEHLKYLIAYVHHNPIHHGLTTDFSTWQYTSYRAILSKKSTKIPRATILDLFNDHFGNSETTAFLEYHRNFKAQKRSDYLLLDFEKQFLE